MTALLKKISIGGGGSAGAGALGAPRHTTVAAA
jgi:hypothetical protein